MTRIITIAVIRDIQFQFRRQLVTIGVISGQLFLNANALLFLSLIHSFLCDAATLRVQFHAKVQRRKVN